MEEPMNVVETFASENDLPWSEEISRSLSKYVDELLHFNKAMNLIGPLNREEILETLIVDSLSAAVAHPPAGTVLDVGTGAGLPGVPLAILFPDATFTLVEPRKKRANFLRIIKNRLGLENVSVVEARIEDIDEQHFDYAISKAFRPPTEWIEEAQKWVQDGVIVCMHAKESQPETNLEQIIYQESGDRAVSVFRRT